MVLNDKQERVFKVIDELIDSDAVRDGEGREVSLPRYIGLTPSLRIRLIRNFGSVVEALAQYGYTSGKKPISRNQLIEEIKKCAYVEDDLYIRFRDGDLDWIYDFYEVAAGDMYKAKVFVMSELRREAVFNFLENADVDDISDLNKKDSAKKELLRKSIWKTFGSRKNAYKCYGFHKFMVNKSDNPIVLFSKLGRDFEDAVLEVFADSGVTVIYNREQVPGCRPDFTLSDRWVDTKLSKSTVLSAADSTLSKYPQHTDNLDIIYALDDLPDEEVPELPEGVRLVCVFDYFDEIPTDLKMRIERIIEKASDYRKRRWSA